MKDYCVETYQNKGYYKCLQYMEDFTFFDIIYCSDMGAFLICSQGEMQISINMQEYVLSSNSILTLLPNSVFKMKECTQDFKGHLIVFPSSLAESSDLKENLLYFLVHVNERPVLHITDSRMALALEYVTLIRSLYEQPEVLSYPIVNGIIHSFLYILYVGYSLGKEKRVRTSLSRKDIIFKDFINLVGTYYMKERQVEFYADKLCITSQYLSLVIKEVYGHAPSYIINHAVILAAKAKLQTKQYSVQQVANSLNFCNASFFGKFFKKHVGCSPGKYQTGCYK